MTRDEVLLARGTADAFALRRKYPRRRDVARRYAPHGPDGARHLRRDGNRPLRGGGRARHARHRGQHRREDRERGRPQGLWPDHAGQPMRRCRWRRATWCGRWPPGATCRRAAECDGPVARLHRGAGRRHAGKPGPCAGRPGGLCAAGAQGDRRPGLWRPAGRRPRRPEDDGATIEAEEEDQDSPDRRGAGRGRTTTARPQPERSQEEQQDQSQAQVTMDDSADMEQGDEAETARGRGPAGAAAARARIPTPTRTIPSITTDFDEEIRPRIWPNRPNWNACAPIWTSSLSR
jgi:cobaltochelatase CobT